MFLPWIETEFGMSVRASQHFMHVAEPTGPKSASLAHLPLEASSANVPPAGLWTWPKLAETNRPSWPIEHLPFFTRLAAPRGSHTGGRSQIQHQVRLARRQIRNGCEFTAVKMCNPNALRAGRTQHGHAPTFLRSRSALTGRIPHTLDPESAPISRGANWW
jgi:hypothetical protein